VPAVTGTAALMVLAMTLFVVVPLAAFATWMWRLGARTIATERYPPEGVRMLGRFDELRGEPARRRGRLAQIFAIIFLALATVFGIFTWRLGQLLAGGPL
jgi:hypothetical protein